jgi:hypothetical protein
MIIKPMEKSRETIIRIAPHYPIPPGPISGLSNSSTRVPLSCFLLESARPHVVACPGGAHLGRRFMAA